MGKRLFLLDGHSLAHRAFYALPLLQNSEGEYTNAVFGFARMLFKLIDDEKPDLMLVAFDKKAPTFRHEEYEDYKANRKKMPDELSPQISLIKKLLEYLKIPILSLEGYEADDVIGTLAVMADKKGIEVKIVTGDRDSLQLVNAHINVLYTRKGISDIVEYNKEKIQERYGLSPRQLIDMKGLMGDSSDNIPGVPGIGEKTAIKLLKEFSDLENILANIAKVSGKKRKENLSNYAEQARLSKRLGEIMVDVPLKIDFADCKLEAPVEGEIVPFLERLEFTSLIDRFKTTKKLMDNDVQIKDISNAKELDGLLEILNDSKEIALEVLLEDDEHPVSSRIEEILLGVEKEVYAVAEELLDKLKDFFNDSKIKKDILHAKETMIALKKKGIELAGLSFDPLLAAYLLKPSDKLPSLEEQIKLELNLEMAQDLSVQKRSAVLLANLPEIKAHLIKRLEETNLLAMYQDIELPLIKVLAEMEINGIALDKDYLAELSSRWGKELADITEKIYSLSGVEFNINSPKQLGEVLFDEIGLPVIKKTKTGYSTSAEVLDKLENKHEIIPLIKNYRQLMKLKSTYVDALPPLVNPETGRVHTSFNQMITATGRLSSTEPNLQNIPIRTEEGREIRKAFIPAEGRVLLAVDYSQVELRVLAHISGDKNMLKAFKEAEDIHQQTASEIFGVEAGEVTPNMRREAKVINFGIAYGMSPYGLARDLKIGRREAEDYIKRYFERFPGVKEYMNQVKENAKRDGYVTTIFDRRRYIPEIKSRNFHRRSFAERMAINTPIQGSAADIIKLAMLRVYESLKKESYQSRILLQVHDELVLEVPHEELSAIAKMVKGEMENAVELTVPLIADIQVGENWRDKKRLSFRIDEVL
ncbi:MAG: DNA polymerase I [Firmicutes bacterium]|nr:DNA polymerase I [Bacillota bacterium]